MKRRIILAVASGLMLASAAVGTASADPIVCPPGQVAALNPAGGGWVCVNAGGNTNLSEDPKSPNKDKGDFAR